MAREKIQYHPLRCSDIQVSKFPSSTDRNKKKMQKQNSSNKIVLHVNGNSYFWGSLVELVDTRRLIWS